MSSPLLWLSQALEDEFPGQIDKIYNLVAGENYRKAFQETGDPDNSVWSCGPVVALINDIPTCKELIDRMIREAREVVYRCCDRPWSCGFCLVVGD